MRINTVLIPVVALIGALLAACTTVSPEIDTRFYIPQYYAEWGLSLADGSSYKPLTRTFSGIRDGATIAFYTGSADKAQKRTSSRIGMRLISSGLDDIKYFRPNTEDILVIKSGFFPRVLGILLMVAGFAYLTSSVTSIVLPAYSHVVSQAMMPLYFGGLPMIFWLLIKGAKVQLSPNGIQRDARPLAQADRHLHRLVPAA